MASVTASFDNIARFTNDAGGLEKALRFMQSFTQTVAAYTLTAADAAPWLQARNQLALGRRYFRFFKWIDCFAATYASVQTSMGIPALLSAGKWSCLGMFILLESFTTLDAMGVWPTTWASPLWVEAMRFWFFSISFSIALSLFQLLDLSSQPSASNSSEKTVNGRTKRSTKGSKAQDVKIRRQAIIKALVSDSCDILIPGAVTGWLRFSSATVGTAGMLSTILVSTDIFNRVKR